MMQKSEAGMKQRLTELLAPYQGERGVLIPVLQQVQGEFGYISEQAVSEIARFLAVSQSEIYGVATFYAQFRFTRPGEHMIKVCQGTACHVRGGARIMETVERELGINPGETTEDYKFSLERVACFGCCALSPVMVVDDTVYSRMTPAKAKHILASY
jgi:NADH-quinone oxidoreductase subunit E